MAQALLVRDDLHGTASEHIARTHQHRVADAGGGLHAGLDVGDGLGLGLRDAQLFHDLFEATAVFGVPDRLRIGTDNGHAQLRQRLGQVDGRLSAERHDDRLRFFEVDDVHHVLDHQRFEIELVAGSVVRRHGFGVVVDDNRLVTGLADRPDGMHGRVVELNALADTDRARAEHHDLLLIAHNRLVLVLVSRVEIGHIGAEFAGTGVDHLVDGEEAVLFAQPVYVLLRDAPQLADELVAEPHALGVAQGFDIHRVRFHLAFEFDDVLELFEEEHVDLRIVVDQHQVDAVADQLRDGIEAVVRSVLDVFQQLHVRPAVEFLVVDMADTRFERAQRLQEAFLHRAADGHHLARGLHLRTQLVRRIAELVEREAGDFGDHVIERRLEAGGRIGQHDLVERKPYGDLGRHTRDRIAAGLRRQGRRARHAGVHLDQVVFERQGVECELHVATALDLQLADNLQRRVAQHLELLVGKRLARRHDDRVARMHAHGVDILHAADADGRVVMVAHHLELDLLVALDALLDEHLVHGRKEQGVAHHFAQLLLVVDESAARTAQRIGGTQHDGIADLGGDLHGLLDRHGDFRFDHRFAQRLAQLLEKFAVFGAFDRLERGAQDLDLALFQDTLLGKLHRKVQARLSAQPRHDGVGTLETDDLGHVFERQGFHVDLVCDMRIGHDRRRVGIHQDYLVSLLLECEARLRTRIVEFRGLADDDRAGTDDHYLVYISSLRHFYAPPLFW